MPNRLTLILISTLLAASIAGAQSVPTVVNYQGRLLENAPTVDATRFDSAAALVMLATLDPLEDMPASLVQSLSRAARSRD